jgi:hypothetical protein
MFVETPRWRYHLYRAELQASRQVSISGSLCKFQKLMKQYEFYKYQSKTMFQSKKELLGILETKQQPILGS